MYSVKGFCWKCCVCCDVNEALVFASRGADKVIIIRPVQDKILTQRNDFSEVPCIDNSKQPKSKEENVANVEEEVKNAKIPENHDITQEDVLVDFDIDKKQAAEFSGNRNALQVFPSDNTNILIKRHLDDSYKSNEYSEIDNSPLCLRTEGVKRSRLMTEVEDPDTYCDTGRQSLSRISDYNECQTQYMKHNIKFYWYYPTKTRKPIFPTKIKHLKDGSVRRYLGRELRCHIKTLIATQGRKTIPVTKDVATNTSINTLADQQQYKKSNLQKDNQNVTATVPVKQKVSEPKKESVETKKTMPSTSQNTRANENQHLKSILNLDTVPFGIPIAFQNLYNKIIMQKNEASTVPKLESQKNTDGSYDFWWSYPHDMSDRNSNSGLRSQNPSKSVVSAPKNIIRLGDSSKSRPPIETQLHKKQQRTKDGPGEINKPAERIVSNSNIKNERRPENKERQSIKIISQCVLQERNPNVEEPQQNVNSDLNLQRPVYDDRNVVIGRRRVNTKPNPEVINPPAMNIDRHAINSPQPISIEREQLNIQHHQVNIEQQPMIDRQQLDNESSSSDSSDSPEPTDAMQQFHAHRRPIYGFPPYVLPSHGLQPQVLPPYVVQPQVLPPYAVPPQGLPPYVLPPQGLPPYVLQPQSLPPYVLQPQGLPPYFYPQQVLPPQMWPMAIRPEPNAEQEPANIAPPQVIDRQQPNEVQQRAHNVPQNLGQKQLPIVEQQTANIARQQMFDVQSTNIAMQNNIVRRQLNEYQEAINIAPKKQAECRHQRMVERRQLNVEPQPVNIASQQVVERLPLNLARQPSNIASQQMAEILPLNLAQQSLNIASQRMVERLPLNLAQQPSNIASQQMAERLAVYAEPQTVNREPKPMVARLEQYVEQQAITATANRPLAQPQQQQNNDREIERIPFDDPGFMNYFRQIRESFQNFQELLLEGVRPHSPRNPENDPRRQLESPSSQSVPSPVSSPPLDANVEATGRPPVLAHIRLQPLGSPPHISNPNDHQIRPNMRSVHWDSPDWFEIVRAWLPSPDSAV